jgi:anti-sigma factor RsiW
MTPATCHEVGDELVAYLDDELTESERRPIANHVATCLVCRREIEQLAAVGRLVRDLPRVEPGSDFAAAFWERLDAEPRDRLPQVRSLRSMRWALPGLAVAALLALGLSSLLRVATQPTAPATGGAARVVTAPAPATQPKVANAPATNEMEAAPQLANVDDLKPEDLPPALLEHPELFLRLPVVRRLDKLEHFEAVQQEPASEDGAG